MRKMEVIVGCETSGVVRDEFRKKGHNATSCDILPTEKKGPHIQADLLEVLHSGKVWDIGIFHPPCTFICSSGLHWNKRTSSREQKTFEALQFVCDILNAGTVKQLALENPVGCISTRIVFEEGKYKVIDSPDKKRGYKPTQTIQPYEFNEDASKKTCLWLRGLPPLKSTGYYPPRITKDGKKRWSNQTDSGQNKLPPSADRWKERSKTYKGIAQAMAQQWAV